MDQIKFEFPRGDEEPRRKRYRKRQPLPAPKAAPLPPSALLQTPVVQKCGFCGENQTLMGETHVCGHCGGILLRREGDD
ncbi:MAG: hypothetical protein WCP21_04870 [Armatimonadota bacterium]